MLVASPARAGELRAMDEEGRLTGPFASLEAHVSLFNDMADRSMISGSVGYGARGGYRWKSWGLFLEVEQNAWLATEYETDAVPGAVNLAVGGEYLYARGFVRTALAIGPSILVFDTPMDDVGTVGLFLDARPVGLRWSPHELLVIGLDPINFTVVAPALGGIPLICFQYRTILYLEAAF